MSGAGAGCFFGNAAEVDFADAWVRLAGEPVRCHMFTLRLSFSGKSVHRVYASQRQGAFMQGHVEAFAVLGGIPFRHVRYDNLKSAVGQVCFSRSRVESQRWTAFRFQRTRLVPVPEVETLAELNPDGGPAGL